MKGFHYTDLFYWEHRLGTWVSGTLRAARADHLTYILYNCRTLIETLIARPLEERNTADVPLALIREMWPELLSVPIFSGSKFFSTTDEGAEMVSVGGEALTTTLVESNRGGNGQPALAEIVPVGGVQTALGKRLQNPSEQARQVAILSYPWSGRVLDIGIGHGHVACQIALAYRPDLLVGIDLAVVRVKGARKLARANGIARCEVAAARGERLPFAPRSFDRVHLSQVLEHVHRPDDVLREVARVLRPGGTALIAVPGHGKMPPGTVAGHVQDFTVAAMRQLIEDAGLETIEQCTVGAREFHFVRLVAQPPTAAG
jgi:SAM-dependent methyltransferase